MYHPSNANLTMYGAGWRMRLLALCGRLLGIQFHVQGLPFGAAYDRQRTDAWFAKQNAGSLASGPDHISSAPLGAGALGSPR